MFYHIFRSAGVVIETPHSIAQLRLGCSLRLDCCALFVRGSVSSSAMPIIAVALHARGAVLAHVALIVGVTRRHAQDLSSQKTTMEKALVLHKLTRIDKLQQENFPLPP